MYDANRVFSEKIISPSFFIWLNKVGGSALYVLHRGPPINSICVFTIVHSISFIRLLLSALYCLSRIHFQFAFTFGPNYRRPCRFIANYAVIVYFNVYLRTKRSIYMRSAFVIQYPRFDLAPGSADSRLLARYFWASCSQGRFQQSAYPIRDL